MKEDEFEKRIRICMAQSLSAEYLRPSQRLFALAGKGLKTSLLVRKRWMKNLRIRLKNRTVASQNTVFLLGKYYLRLIYP